MPQSSSPRTMSQAALSASIARRSGAAAAPSNAASSPSSFSRAVAAASAASSPGRAASVSIASTRSRAGALRIGITSREGKRKSSLAAEAPRRRAAPPCSANMVSRRLRIKRGVRQRRFEQQHRAIARRRARRSAAPRAPRHGARSARDSGPGRRARRGPAVAVEAAAADAPCASAEAGGGGRRRSGCPGACTANAGAAGARAAAGRTARRSGCEQFVAILRRGRRGSAIVATWSISRRLSPARCLGRVERLGVAFVRATAVRPAARARRAAPRTPRGRRARTRSSGSWPGGQGDEAQRCARARAWGRARDRGAHRRLLPGRIAVEAQDRHVDQPPQQLELRLGQRGAERRDRLVEARPGRARSRPYSLRRRSRGRPCATAGAACRGCRACGPCRKRRVGRVQIFGLAVAEDAPAEGDHPPARVADREHQPAAEAVVGLLVVDGLISRPASTSIVVAELLERGLRACRAHVGREAEAERLRASPRRCRAASR